MDDSVLNYIRDLDISIKKKMFLVGKKNHIKNAPSPLQVRIFMYLYEHKDANISPMDLSRELNVSKVAISEALTKMENNGNITIKESEDDGRKKIITYSNQGVEKMNQMLSSLEALNKELIKNIDEEELNIFINVLKKMKENIKEEENV